MHVNGHALLTDLYELTMMQGYYYHLKNMHAVFDMFFRHAPFNGGYAVFAGLAPLVDELCSLRFTRDDIEYLKSQKIFTDDFLGYLQTFRFTGDVYAAPEGAVVFPNEPLVRVEGNIIECQLIESLLLNIVNFQTLIATKASRIFNASRQGSILEFGLRRAQGVDGAISATRAAYIGGASATSNVLAGKMFGIPVAGTMAHSWVMAFPDERQAFMEFAKLYPDRCILLVDTFDTIKSGIPNAITVFREMREKGLSTIGIRLDSGDLEYLSKLARREFDRAGFTDAKIYASNELDENIIHQLVSRNAPIDSWGVGTSLVTAQGDSSLSGVYKIVAKKLNGAYLPTMKISNTMEKITNPCRKNVARIYDTRGIMLADLIVADDAAAPDAALRELDAGKPVRLNHPSNENVKTVVSGYGRYETLLTKVIEHGEPCADFPPLAQVRAAAIRNLASLDDTHRRFINPHIYKVSLSNGMKDLKFGLMKRARADTNNSL